MSYYAYHTRKEDTWTTLGESSVSQPIKSALNFSSLIEEHCSAVIPREVHRLSKYQGPSFDFNGWRIILSVAILPIYLACTIPATLTSFATVVVGSALIPLLVLIGDMAFLAVVVCASLVAILMTIFRSFDEGLRFCRRVAMSVPESYLDMIFGIKKSSHLR
ncbi:1700_t:CDS:2 [Acaulospora colombiana]|uniref:1700_t:CDS:1 n=1 Tax=Acaulospora colombiana TaxID=27376 RepID=A0ACA9JUZ5_9GLOM|nr:1700_t:CDS:2 [Acaulospora colombiana]